MVKLKNRNELDFTKENAMENTMTELHKIHQMRLHECYKVDDTLRITRVAGGWIYHSNSDTFVPYSSEFQPLKYKIGSGPG